jgi:hypothetical protein
MVIGIGCRPVQTRKIAEFVPVSVALARGGLDDLSWLVGFEFWINSLTPVC